MPALFKAVLALALTALSGGAAADNACSSSTDNIQGVMYFNSKPKDAAACTLHVKDGRIAFDPVVSNPGMSCPDAASWKLFADAVTQEFWAKWASDQQTWPGTPLALCGTGTTANCCTFGAATNPGYDNKDNPAINCPYFPGDHLKRGALPPVRNANPPSKAHFNTFTHGIALMKLASPDSNDTGREIRQSMAELVFRNEPMFDFVFRNNLYNQEGIQDVFARNATNITAKNSLPYRAKSSTGQLTEIDFPIDSVMIKSNWIEKERALKLGLRDDPEAPYIKMTIATAVNDNNAPIFKPGEHWLVAFHISSKDTPNWVWATWEHVNNPGRCDYIGCNDSFGYASADKVGANQAVNYTTPHTQCDNLDLASWVFKLNQTYPSGPRSKNLGDTFNALGIGTKAPAYADGKQLVPSVSDRGWLSYRLKGAQVDFTDSTGVPTLLGNSVTEGGFMQTSSCITCHARAGTNAGGWLLAKYR
ncbi:MAG TPA: hypothetical protein VM555_11195, partial [Tahibacter sp.]|nr:hypothetical protein [Tahibacter sp.]